MRTKYNGLKISIDKFLSEHLSDVVIVNDPTELPDTEPDSWISVIYGDCDLISITKSAEISFHCLSKNDDGGFIRAQLIDKLIAAFEDATQDDEIRRIPFYIVENGSLVQVSTILASDTFIDGHYRLTTDITGQSVRFSLIWN